MIWINAILQYTNRPHCQDFVFQSPPLDFFFFLLMSCTTLYQHLIKEKKKLNWRGVPVPKIFIYTYTHTHFVFKEWFEYSLECAFLQAFQNANWILNDNMWKHKINAELCPITSTHICCNNYFPQSEDTKANKATCLLCSEISLMLQVSKCGKIFSFFLFLSYKKSFVSLWHLLKSRENCLTLCRANNVGL